MSNFTHKGIRLGVPRVGGVTQLALIATTTSSPQNVWLDLIAPVGADMTVEWGDGQRETINDGHSSFVIHEYADVGTYELKLYDTSYLTALWLSDTALSGNLGAWKPPSGMVELAITGAYTGDISHWQLSPVQEVFSLFTCPYLTGDFSHFVIPDTMTNFTMSEMPGLTADITGWALAPVQVTFKIFELGNFHGLTGDITYLVQPDTLETLSLGHNYDLEGDLTDWEWSPVLKNVYLQRCNLSGNGTNWGLPSTLIIFTVHSNNFTGNPVGWNLGNSIDSFLINENLFAGDITGMPITNAMRDVRWNDTGLYGVPDVSGNTKLHRLSFQNCSLTQGNVDSILAALYANRDDFTNQAPYAECGGNNAEPSGVCQDEDPPVTGYGYMYELKYDPESEGFKTWTFYDELPTEMCV